jgi:hypothetical protein
MHWKVSNVIVVVVYYCAVLLDWINFATSTYGNMNIQMVLQFD